MVYCVVDRGEARSVWLLTESPRLSSSHGGPLNPLPLGLWVGGVFLFGGQGGRGPLGTELRGRGEGDHLTDDGSWFGVSEGEGQLQG